MPAGAKRGPYAKGLERRGQILAAALDAYASSGPQGPSLRSIADSVNLTEAGVLHYFGGKDELLVEVLVARDLADLRQFDLSTADGFWALLEHAAETPGLVKLLVDMLAAGASPDHPAHKFMRDRSTFILKMVGRLLGDDDPWKARIVLAAAEGLDVQWLRDPSIDIVGDLKRLFEVLGGTAASRAPTVSDALATDHQATGGPRR